MIYNRINICYWDNNGGLSLDAKIITKLLESNGFHVFHNGYVKEGSKLQRLQWKLLRNCLVVLAYFGVKRFAVNIHLESILEKNIAIAKKNIMIANLEWLHDSSYDFFPNMDLFACKTKSAKQFLDGKGFRTVFTSFSTISPYDGRYKQQANSFVHIGGKSETKGSIPLIHLWSKHPEWPKLTVLISPDHYSDLTTRQPLKQFESDNLEIIEDYIDLADLRRLQNESEVHLCPSEGEGFGHYICEPLSCGSIVVTVNGEPMNELVQPDRGILVEAGFSEPLRYATRFLFDAEDFEKKIAQFLAMTDAEKEQMKSNGQKWFAENDTLFQKSFIQMMRDCVGS